MNINNKLTIRIAVYMDEELYQSVGKAYLKYVKEKAGKQYLALESDGGAFTPSMFTVDAPKAVVDRIAGF
ncbi:MAG: hypothetical protein ACOYMF_16175 [Bacteroidales bacterium]